MRSLLVMTFSPSERLGSNDTLTKKEDWKCLNVFRTDIVTKREACSDIECSPHRGGVLMFLQGFTIVKHSADILLDRSCEVTNGWYRMSPL